MGIKFGTDGWRAIIAESFTFDNLRLVTQAIAEYVNNSEDPGEGIVVGYDQRFLAEQFAEAVAEVLAGNGIKVFLTAKPTPTPVTAFAIKDLNCKGAIMLTASHNPAIYHGIKYIPYFAGPALPGTTERIEEAIRKAADVKKLPFTKLKENGLLEYIEPQDKYLNHLKELIDISIIRESPVKIIIDPMYGAGIGYLERFLEESGCNIKVLHNKRDPLFGGGMPEPKKDQLGELRDQVLEENATIGLALDGDADRFGVIDSNGSYIRPNEVLALVLEHLITTRKWRGPVARTVATTHMLDAICDEINENVYETAVGFKYIGQALRNEGCILGGEESGGMSIKGHIPEKDGIIACLLVLEMVCARNTSIGDILKELREKYGPYYSDRLDLKILPEKKEKLVEKIADYEPNSINGKKVVERISVDGTKLILEDGSWILIRPSGTEPLFRIYAESFSHEDAFKLQQEIKDTIFKDSVIQ